MLSCIHLGAQDSGFLAKIRLGLVLGTGTKASVTCVPRGVRGGWTKGVKGAVADPFGSVT